MEVFGAGGHFIGCLNAELTGKAMVIPVGWGVRKEAEGGERFLWKPLTAEVVSMP